jgi:Ca-activated chloride channel family protein
VLPFHIEQQDEHVIRGTVDAVNIDLAEDFSTVWSENEPQNAVEVIAYRNPNPIAPAALELASSELAVPTQAAQKGKQKQQAQTAAPAEPGFFEALAQLSSPAASGEAPDKQGGRTVVVLMDTSLSMQWEKLERSYAAAAKLLETLGPEDKFNLLLFNTRVDSFKPAPVKADLASTKAAMDWLRQSHLRGGTDLQKALEAGLGQFSGTDTTQTTALVLLTDGETTRGLIQTGKLADWYAAKWKQIPAERRPKTEVFAVGDDANLPLLRMLSRNGGVMEQVLSTEPVDSSWRPFWARWDGLRLAICG